MCVYYFIIYRFSILINYPEYSIYPLVYYKDITNI